METPITPLNETKHDKFVRLLQLRLPKALKSIQLIGNLASHNYDFSIEEAQDIRLQLIQSVDEIMAKFRTALDPEEKVSSLPPDVIETCQLDDEPLELTRQENLHMIHIGPQIDAAINAISDGEIEKASSLLLNLMRS